VRFEVKAGALGAGRVQQTWMDQRTSGAREDDKVYLPTGKRYGHRVFALQHLMHLRGLCLCRSG
jgi:hypothetical protein